MLNSIGSNSRFGKRSIAREISTFGSHVGAHILNIGCSEYMVVYGSIQWYMGVYEVYGVYVWLDIPLGWAWKT